MAAESKKTAEGADLSMEEILQSIRKIIADEDKPSEVEPEEEFAPATDALGSDVLELTEMVEEPASGRDVLQEIDDAFGADEAEVPQATQVPVAPPEAPPEEPDFYAEPADDVMEAYAPQAADRLISDQAASASSKAFQKVIQTHKATTPMPHFRNNETIEDLVLEVLKPLLKEWLDAHLPTMVERIVEREISKLVE